MQDALNKQIKLELESSYLYLAMAAYFHAAGLDGLAQWMRVQAREETTHAMKLFDHLVARGGRVELDGLAQPPKEWESPLAAFIAAYGHEQHVTAKIHALVKLTTEQADYAIGILLQWFVTEQVEEEASVAKVVETLKKIGASGSGLIMYDRQLGKRE
jgi:ferritin